MLAFIYLLIFPESSVLAFIFLIEVAISVSYWFFFSFCFAFGFFSFSDTIIVTRSLQGHVPVAQSEVVLHSLQNIKHLVAFFFPFTF